MSQTALREVVRHNLHELRLDKGLSRAELASSMRVGVWTVARVEQGAFGPTLDYVEDAVKALGVPLARVFER